MAKHFFKEGDDVAHKENLTLKMTVKKVIRKKVKIPGTDKDLDKMIGIQCEWWIGDRIIKHPFHSKELVPWNIAEQGKDAVIEWLTSEAGNYEHKPTIKPSN